MAALMCAPSVTHLSVHLHQARATLWRARVRNHTYQPSCCFSLKSHIPVVSHGRDQDEAQGVICPGCGVFMQNHSPHLPGFFLQPTKILTQLQDDDDDYDGEYLEEPIPQQQHQPDDFEWDSLGEKDDENSQLDDGFGPVGVGYGNVTQDTLDKLTSKRIDRKRKIRQDKLRSDEDMVTVCARCHSLRNYGQVKNPNADNLIPEFDFERLINTRFVKPTGNSDASVLVMVVDCVDFDASFPKRAANALSKALQARKKDPKLKPPKLLLVATKLDLLPSQISPTRLDRWVRNRAKANGAPKLTGVFMVSSRKDLGVKNLLSFIKELAGPRGHVWVIGSQNAGKSTLINALSKKQGTKTTKLTEAAVPGTTLGILRIAGILPAKAKMYDTPGLLHPYLMSVRLNRDEQKLVEIRKELKPRTFRIKAGQTIHVGALMRLDLNEASVQTIYATVWASPNVSLHMGKTENAEEMWRKHSGTRLQPPVGEDRVSELGKWEKQEYNISGISWEVNAVDIAVAGLGWFSLGIKGEANIALWTYDGVQVTLREPLILDRAPFLERPGFLLPKAVSEGIGNLSKAEFEKRNRLESLSSQV